MSRLAEFFQSVKLPVVSEVTAALFATLQDDDAPVARVRDIISRDPVLAGQLLRLANSAGFGLSRKIASLDDAIALAGLSRVRAMALAIGVSGGFPQVPGLDRVDFWANCVRCAAYSQWLAERLEMDAQQAWISGLMLRLGELMMGQINPGFVAQIERLPKMPGDRWLREMQLLGFTEGEMTALLARHWLLPEEMARAMETSSRPLESKPFSPLGGILHLAALLSDVPDCRSDSVYALPEAVMQKLHLNAESLQNDFPQVEVSPSFIEV